MALNWLVGSHRGFGCAWATSLPNQATAKETAVNCPLQPNISIYYHKVIFVCLVPIKSCRPKGLEGCLTGSKTRKGHFYGEQSGSRCFLDPPPTSPPEGGTHLFLITAMGESSLWTRVPGPCGAGRRQSPRTVCSSAAMWVWIGCVTQPACLLAVTSNKASGGFKKRFKSLI